MLITLLIAGTNITVLTEQERGYILPLAPIFTASTKFTSKDQLSLRLCHWSVYRLLCVSMPTDYTVTKVAFFMLDIIKTSLSLSLIPTSHLVCAFMKMEVWCCRGARSCKPSALNPLERYDHFHHKWKNPEIMLNSIQSSRCDNNIIFDLFFINSFVGNRNA